MREGPADGPTPPSRSATHYELSDQSSAFQVTPTLEVLGRTPFRLFDQAQNTGCWYSGSVTMFCQRVASALL